jgi:hypothetical protein
MKRIFNVRIGFSVPGQGMLTTEMSFTSAADRSWFMQSDALDHPGFSNLAEWESSVVEPLDRPDLVANYFHAQVAKCIEAKGGRP